MCRLHQDQILPGSEILQNVDDLHIELFRGRALEHGQAVALHPALDLFDTNGVFTQTRTRPSFVHGQSQGATETREGRTHN